MKGCSSLNYSFGSVVYTYYINIILLSLYQFVEYLTDSPLVFEVWGRQKDGGQGKGVAKASPTNMKNQLVKQKNDAANVS